MIDFPRRPEDLSSQWLSDALGFEIESFDIVPFGEGVGMIARVVRLALETADENPQSLIAKFPTLSEGNRMVASTYNMYGREVMFYSKFAERVELLTPRCFYSIFDEETEDFILLLEDLGHLAIGDQVDGCSLHQAKQILSAIAGLHASTWMAEDFPDLISHNNKAQHDGMVQAFQIGWPKVLDKYSDLIPDAALISEERMVPSIQRLLDLMTDGPICFCHVDVRLDNIFFRDDDVLFVDWQSIATSCPEQDVAYFIMQNVKPSVRAEEDLVLYYHNELVKRGIANYDLDYCRERYRIAGLYLLCFAVSIAGELDLVNERGMALGRTITENTFSALDEINAFSLLGK